MRLEVVPNAPDWLKRDPVSGFYRVVIYRAGHGRLDKSTKEKTSYRRAEAIGERLIGKWLGHELAGKEAVVLFKDAVAEVDAAYQAKLARGKVRIGTVEQFGIYGPKLAVEFGHLPLATLNKGHWDRYVALYQKEKPGKTLYNQWKHMSTVMSHAFDCGYIKKPWKVENPDPKKKAGRVLTRAEKAGILAEAGPDLLDQLIIAMTMGMRLREHLKLSWERVDFARRVLVLRPEDTKTKTGRVLKLSPQVENLLRARRKADPTGLWVFPAPRDRGQPVHSNKKAWATAKASAGIAGRCRYHDLRHTFATECAVLVREGKVSVVLVCAYLGMSIKTFERVYLHLTHEDTAPVASLIAVKLRGNRSQNGGSK